MIKPLVQIAALLLIVLAGPLTHAQEDWRKALENWKESRQSQKQEAAPAKSTTKSSRDDRELSEILQDWRKESNEWGDAYLEKYHPQYKTVSVDVWIDLNSRALEGMIERRLTGAERTALTAELKREHAAKKGRFHQSAALYHETLAAMARRDKQPVLARAAAKRLYSRIFYGNTADTLNDAVFWKILQKSDPIRGRHAASGTLLLKSDAVALAKFKAALSGSWPNNISADAVRDADRMLREMYASSGKQACTFGVRRLALIDPLTRGAQREWANLTDTQRYQLAGFITGGSKTSAGLLKRVTGVKNARELYALAGAHWMDTEERRMIESAEAATAMMYGDPVSTLSVLTPTIQAAWAKHIAKCGA